jgi:hypothetical protein
VLQPDVVVGNNSLWRLLSMAPNVDVFVSQPLTAAAKVGATITNITTVGADGADTVWMAAVFVDASYGGDLVVAGGISHTYGREANTTYNETLAGVQPFNKFQNFLTPVDPFDAEGRVLPYVDAGALPPLGSGDSRLMPCSYRACLWKGVAGQLPFPKPRNYNNATFELLRRYVMSFPSPPALTDLVGVLPYGGPVPYPATPSRPMRYRVRRVPSRRRCCSGV